MSKKTKLATVRREVSPFHDEIKKILQTARGKAQSAVNFAMVEAYWLIGKRIVEEEQGGEAKAQYGKRLLENLSSQLSHEFGKGFSYANLRNFRQFYQTYPDQEICYTLCSKLSWSHNRLILCDSKDATIVKYSVLKENEQIFASKYQRILPTEAELVAEIAREKRLIEGLE